MTPRIRVLHAIQNLNYGGMERLFADIVRLLDRDRFESHVLVLDYFGRFAEGLDRCAELHLAPPLPRYSMLWPGPLARLIARIDPDVVHTHAGIWYKVSLAARRAKVPRIVHTEHGRRRPDPLIDRAIGYLASRRTDVIVAVSEVLREQLARTVVADPSRLVFLPNGVDTDLHAPQADDGRLRRELGVSREAPIIGSIGRLEPIKGYDIMLEAFRRLRAEWTSGAPPVLVVGGDGSERQRLERRIDELRLRDSVHLLGWRDGVRELHCSFGLFTMASRSEGTSVSLLEAMSAGLCPVVTDVGGNAAVLGRGLAHRLVPPLDPAALAQAWRQGLGDPEGLRSDGTAARSRVIAAFSLQAMVQGYSRLYFGQPVVQGAPMQEARP